MTSAHVITLDEYDDTEVAALIDLAQRCKADPAAYAESCAGRGLAILMEKTSTRTKLSFAAAITEMGGWFFPLEWSQSNFSIAPARHEIRYLGTTCALILARVRSHEVLRDLAANSTVPLINGCDDRFHPSQALADLITIREVAGRLRGVVLAYVGVYNNVANALTVACLKAGVELRLVTPVVNEHSVDHALRERARQSGHVHEVGADLAGALDGADFVYTDTWIDMEWFNDPSYAPERERRMAIMAPLQLNERSLAPHDPWIMHPMPIHPGLEIAEQLIDHPRSVIFHQAGNRLCAAKALILSALERHEAP